MKIERLTNPGHDFINRLGDGLSEHAARALGSQGFLGVGVAAISEPSDFVGGIQAWVNWNWLQIYLVWIDAAHRGAGLGSQMLAEIELIGRERGCKRAHLDTFSFQAPGFYEKHGYTRVAELENYPPGESRIYLCKTL